MPADVQAVVDRRGITVHSTDRKELDGLCQQAGDAAHQGWALECDPLPAIDFATWLMGQSGVPSQSETLVVLDGVTDVRNIGAIARLAWLQGAQALILPSRGTPEETPALVKTAVGAWDLLPIIRVGNLRAALQKLKDRGWWIHGLALGGTLLSSGAAGNLPDRLVIVAGSEGKGMRALTRDSCDQLWELPMTERATSEQLGAPESHNVVVALGMAMAILQRQA